MRYNFRSMSIGDFKFITGVKPKHPQMAWYRYKSRHPELRNRQYQWWAVNGGIRLERVG